jgi:hypothetical protein
MSGTADAWPGHRRRRRWGDAVTGGEPVSGVHLEADEIAALDAASDPAPADYPYGGPGNEQRSRLISGGRARKPGADAPRNHRTATKLVASCAESRGVGI